MNRNHVNFRRAARLALVMVSAILMLLCTLTAYAQETVEEQLWILVKLEIPETESSEASVRYLLAGEGDGLEAFDHCAPADGVYAERFEALWETVLQAEPQVALTGDLDALAFEAVQEAEDEAVMTQILVNGETVAEVEGQVAFVILSEGLGEVEPMIGEKLEACIWEPESIARFGGGADGAVLVCAACGELSDGSCGHDVKVSPFCAAGHTLMDGDPVHFCESCETEHPCSKSNSHTVCIKCGNPWCYKAEGDHKELACGHRGCMVYGNSSAHKKCAACGGYLCDGESHKLAACGGHYACEAGDHSGKAACGEHYACEYGGHSLAACGKHFECDGYSHDAASCGIAGHYKCDEGFEFGHAASFLCEIPGHYLCDGREHHKAYCQIHWVCEAGDHEYAPCGQHFACEAGNHSGLAACGEHYACEYGGHSLAACGEHYACEYGGHSLGACGKHFECDGYSHDAASCGIAGHYKCGEGFETGHAASFLCEIPGHYLCDGRKHHRAYCQIHWVCEAGDHDSYAACGQHFACEAGNHSGEAACGRHDVCDDGNHGAAACGLSGHYACDGADHSQCSSAGE